MASIKQTNLTEPLLSRQQIAVVRDIARAIELNNALKELESLKDYSNTGIAALPKTYMDQVDQITKYLNAEINKILMQIKLPKQPIGDPTIPLTDSSAKP